MDTMQAFMRGEANRGKEQRVFDWLRAAEYIKTNNVQYAEAGLAEDWSWTGGDILINGKPVSREDTYTYLASTWATPVLKTDKGRIECWRMASELPGWGSNTFWPKEALEILEIVEE